MLAVFIDELEGGFIEYVEPTSQLMLSLVGYELNDSIRSSVAECLPGLVKCAKCANPDNRDYIIGMGKTFADALTKVLKDENETECLIAQVQALKSVIDEVGAGFFTDVEQVNALSQLGLEQVVLSDKRIEENNEMVKKGGEDDDEVDEDDEKLVKEENKSEYEL
jgi:hypothetical protein